MASNRPMWNIQQILSQRSTHLTAWFTRSGSPINSLSAGQRYWGKQFLHSCESPEFEFFARQAALDCLVQAHALIRPVDVCLDVAQPLLVYPEVQGSNAQDWLSSRAQMPAASILMWVVREVMEVLSALHAAGLVHGQISVEHILITAPEMAIKVVGLGTMEPIGTISSLPRMPNRFDAPERSQCEFEVSSAADIYSAGVLMADLLGASVLETPILQAMLAANPDHRPSAAELVWLLRDLEMQLFGRSISIDSSRLVTPRAA
jgi:Protein kinase domain